MSRATSRSAIASWAHRHLVPPLLCLLVAVCCVRDCWCLRNVRVEVPEAVRRGESVKLVCEYDLEHAALYSIKWYKGDDEFYRYVPKEAPPSRVFPLPGVNVDVSRSGPHSVVLNDVQRELTSFYKCEVSADLPRFHTDVKSALMLVVDVPQDVPSIIIEKLRYSLDEPIAANCTSPASFPAANLTWFINGMQVSLSGSWILEAGNVGMGNGPLETAVAELRLLRPMFREGRLTLRCRATLFTLYTRVTDVTLTLEEPQDASPWPPASVRHHDAVDKSGESGRLARSAPTFFLLVVTSLLLVAVSSCR